MLTEAAATPPAEEFRTAHTLEEAVGLLAERPSRPLAGGVALIPLMNQGLATAARLVYVGRVPELHEIHQTATAIWLGAACTHSELAGSKVLGVSLPTVAAMHLAVGNVRIRDWGTLGGNLLMGDKRHDPPTYLTALGASLEVVSPAGSQMLPVQTLAGAYPSSIGSVIAPHELVRAVVIPLLGAGERTAYLKYTPAAGDYGLVSAGVRVRVTHGLISEARVVIGALGTGPFVSAGAAQVLAGRDLRDPGIGPEVMFAVAGEVPADSDFRGSADYKKHLAGVLAVRVLRRCTAGGGSER